MCPGDGKPHLIAVPAGIPLDNAKVWYKVPKNELELGHTAQCLSCRRVFLIARDQAECVGGLNPQ